jgi:hypothetical protein
MQLGWKHNQEAALLAVCSRRGRQCCEQWTQTHLGVNFCVKNNRQANSLLCWPALCYAVLSRCRAMPPRVMRRKAMLRRASAEQQQQQHSRTGQGRSAMWRLC